VSTKPALSSLSFEQVRQQNFAELEAWLASQPLSAAASPTVHSASTKGSYSGAELSNVPARPGADASLSLPSRMGERLHHRNHCVTDLMGQPVAIPQGD